MQKYKNNNNDWGMRIDIIIRRTLSIFLKKKLNSNHRIDLIYAVIQPNETPPIQH